MKSLKIAAIILIISAGLVGSYLIIKNSSSSLPYSQIENVNGKKLLVEKPIKWVENAIKSDVNKSDVNNFLIEGNNNKDDVEIENKDTVNLTKLVAKTIFEHIKSLDQQGEKPFQGQGFNLNDPENQVLIQEVINNIQNPNFLEASVDDKKIKVSNDNSKENINRYLAAAADVISKNTNNLYRNPTEAIDRVAFGDVSGVLKLAQIYQNLFNDYLNLEVPAALFDLHKRYLILFKKAEFLYEGIAEIKVDPLKAALLIEMAPKVIQEEIDIKKEYYNKAVEYSP